MKIIIETIPHVKQRYETVGDWFYSGKGKRRVLHIRVSKLSDWRREALIAVHELVEVILCRHAGISQRAVDFFDTKFEAFRPAASTAEPGDDDHAPYRKQHCMATGIERLLAAELDVPWADYEEELEKL